MPILRFVPCRNRVPSIGGIFAQLRLLFLGTAIRHICIVLVLQLIYSTIANSQQTGFGNQQPFSNPIHPPGSENPNSLSAAGVANSFNSQLTDSEPELSGNWMTIERLDARSKATRGKGSRWFRTEYSFDNRGFNVLHVMGNSPLPFGCEIWGFIDVEGADVIGADRDDLARYFLEIDLKKKLWGQGGVIAEYNELTGRDNSIGRLGFFHQPNLDFMSLDKGRFAGKGFLIFKVFVYESDGHGSQFSFSWNRTFDNILDGRFSVGGFVDVNFNAGPGADQTVLLSDHQIRIRLFEGLHLITEFRLNEFLQDDFGIAPGVQYRF